MDIEQYKEIASNPDGCKKQEVLPNKLHVEEFVKRLENNLLALVFRRENGSNHLMSFGCELIEGLKLVVDVIFDTENNTVNIQMTGPND